MYSNYSYRSDSNNFVFNVQSVTDSGPIFGHVTAVAKLRVLKAEKADCLCYI